MSSTDTYRHRVWRGVGWDVQGVLFQGQQEGPAGAASLSTDPSGGEQGWSCAAGPEALAGPRRRAPVATDAARLGANPHRPLAAARPGSVEDRAGPGHCAAAERGVQERRSSPRRVCWVFVRTTDPGNRQRLALRSLAISGHVPPLSSLGALRTERPPVSGRRRPQPAGAIGAAARDRGAGPQPG